MQGRNRGKRRQPRSEQADGTSLLEASEEACGIGQAWARIAEDERATVIHDMLDGVQDVFAFFAPARRKALAPRPIRRDAAQQVGRNDPCPCGSGRKYKQCHGGQ